MVKYGQVVKLEVDILESTLKSFQFGIYNGYSEVPERVWGLLKDMADNPVKTVPYAYDIIRAGLEGRIETNAPFYLDAYCRSIETNTRMAEYSRVKKVLSCVDTDGSNDREFDATPYGTVSLSKVSLVAKMEDAFDKLVDDDELMYALRQVRDLNDSFIVNYSVNVVDTLKYAIRGIPSAVSKLKELCSEFSELSEYIRIILSSGIDLCEFFA